MNNRLTLELTRKIKNVGSEIDFLVLQQMIEETLSDYDLILKEGIIQEVPLEETVLYYLECKKAEGLSPTSIKNYLNHLRRLWREIGNKPINRITLNDLRLYVQQRQKVIKNSTLLLMIEIIKCFFSWCHEEQITSENVSKRLVSPKRERNLRKSLTQTEIEIFRQGCLTKRDLALWEFLLSTGARISEVLELKLSDIKNGKIIVKGKGKVERHLNINEKAFYYLGEYIKEREKNGIQSDYLFVGHKKPHNTLTKEAYERCFAIISKNCGIKVVPHISRHTLATTLLERNVDLMTISKLLGHSNLSTSQQYLTVSSDDIQYKHKHFGVI